MATTETELFNTEPYTLTTSTGQTIDAGQVRVGGTLALQLSDSLFARLANARIGSSIRLTGVYRVVGHQDSGKVTPDGDDEITHTVALTLDLIEPDA